MEDYKPGYSNFNGYPGYQSRRSAEFDAREERIGCKLQNLFAISAIYRMFFMVFAAAGIIASAIAKTGDDQGLFPGYATLRIAYLVLTCFAFFSQLVIFIMDVLNVFNVRPLNRFPIIIVILILDALLFFGILICSIFCFVKARNIATDIAQAVFGPVYAFEFFRADSFYVCAIVGYLMSLLYVEEMIFLGFQILAKFLEERKSKRPGNSF